MSHSRHTEYDIPECLSLWVHCYGVPSEVAMISAHSTNVTVSPVAESRGSSLMMMAPSGNMTTSSSPTTSSSSSSWSTTSSWSSVLVPLVCPLAMASSLSLYCSASCSFRSNCCLYSWAFLFASFSCCSSSFRLSFSVGSYRKPQTVYFQIDLAFQKVQFKWKSLLVRPCVWHLCGWRMIQISASVLELVWCPLLWFLL